MPIHEFVVISGCSGGGKSTLLAELSRRGFVTYEEPGRRIVREQLATGGDALPWTNATKFVDLIVARALEQLRAAEKAGGLAFFDRGLVDAANSFLQRNLPVPDDLAGALRDWRYHDRVFIAPPWPEMFANDSERRHSFDDALAEYQSLTRTYESLGYEITTLPKADVSARAAFVIDQLGPGNPA